MSDRLSATLQSLEMSTIEPDIAKPQRLPPLEVRVAPRAPLSGRQIGRMESWNLTKSSIGSRNMLQPALTSASYILEGLADVVAAVRMQGSGTGLVGMSRRSAEERSTLEQYQASPKFEKICKYLGMHPSAAQGWAQLHVTPIYLMVALLGSQLASISINTCMYIFFVNGFPLRWVLPGCICIISALSSCLGFWRYAESRNGRLYSRLLEALANTLQSPQSSLPCPTFCQVPSTQAPWIRRNPLEEERELRMQLLCQSI
jgi:hypothetical protein